MPIIWRPQMSVGNHALDHDHRYLICLINTIELSLRTPDNFDTLDVAMEQLIEYTRDHFDREERLQIKINFPGYIDHKLEHQQIMAELEGLRPRIKRFAEATASPDDAEEPQAGGNGVQRPEQTIDELPRLIRHWIIDHVLTTDTKMREYLARHPANLV